jgi:PilZ domain.
MLMIENRLQTRVTTDIPVLLITVLEMKEGRIVDLSENGAQITGASFKKGTRFQIDRHEQTIYAKVMWDEIDRMGVRFEYPLTSGPLYDEMQQARIPQETPRAYITTATPRSSGFGRRAA